MSVMTLRASIWEEKKLSHSLRLTKFCYDYRFEENQSDPSSIDLILADYDFKIVWNISCTYCICPDKTKTCTWSDMKLQRSSTDFFGSFVLHTNNNPSICVRTFDSKNISKEDSFIFLTVKIEKKSFFQIEFHIYREFKITPTSAYDKLLRNVSLSDVTFVVKGEVIPANKSILALQSDVFESMFATDMLEKKTNTVEIVDIEPKIFKLMLRFVYDGNLDCNETEELLELCKAADKYELRNLVKLCANNACFELCTSNVVDILVVADQVRDDFFKNKCIKFVIENKDQIVKTEGYKNLVKSGRADLLSEIFCQLVKST